MPLIKIYTPKQQEKTDKGIMGMYNYRIDNPILKKISTIIIIVFSLIFLLKIPNNPDIALIKNIADNKYVTTIKNEEFKIRIKIPVIIIKIPVINIFE